MKTQSLTGNWILNVNNMESMPPEAAALPSDIPISIPGDIASALLKADLIQDPYYGRNELDCLWIGRTDWIISTSFQANLSDSAELIFDVIDTVSEIRLNGKIIGTSRNMFRNSVSDIAGALLSGENFLEVIIFSPENFTDAAAAKLSYPVPQNVQLPWQWKNRNLLRKVACHGGWDWGITLMTGGIYTAPVLLQNFQGRVERVHTNQKQISGTSDWNLEIITEYNSRGEQDIELIYEIDGEKSKLTFSVQPGVNTLVHSLPVRKAVLWWPAGFGKQTLYKLTVSTTEEQITKNIGFRDVQVIIKDDEVGRSMTFMVNGRSIFAKGANWIPVDALPSKQTGDVYRRLLEDAVEANMNMIRLWGGGQYEYDCFYDICDELGLMVWHDMMFSCSLYPSDEDFLEEADKEIRYQVKRLKDHACIVLWCGNNEDLGALTWFPESRENRDRYVVDYDRLNEGTVGQAVRELDPGRVWWPSSPSAGYGDYSDCWHDDTKGDMHYWSVWHENLPFESYYDVVPRFCSEFGFQSFPGLKTVESFTPASQLNITSPVMRHHQKNNSGNTIILSTMARYFQIPKNFENYLYLSQVQQAHAMRTAVEFWRAQRPVCMGALYWQLNDNWPVASWSSIEYNGTWKLLHYEVKRFFSPVWLSLYIKNDCLNVVGINDTQNDVAGELTIKLLNFQGDELDSFGLDNTVCGGDSVQVFLQKPLKDLSADTSYSFDTDFTLANGNVPDIVQDGLADRFIYAEWNMTVEGESPKSVQTSLLLCKARDCDLKKAEISVTQGISYNAIVLETNVPVFYVQAETNIEGRFDDAGFTLIPGQKKILLFLTSNGNSIPDNFVDTVSVKHLRDSY